MWLDCQMFEFRHLPSPGGVLQQDPKFLQVCRIVANEQGKEEKRKADKEKLNKGAK